MLFPLFAILDFLCLSEKEERERLNFHIDKINPMQFPMKREEREKQNEREQAKKSRDVNEVI